MLYSKLLTPYKNKEGVLDLNLFEEDLKNPEKSLLNEITLLDALNFNKLIKILLDSGKASLIKDIFTLNTIKEYNLNPSLLYWALKNFCTNSNIDIGELKILTKGINDIEALHLFPLKDKIPEFLEKRLEKSLLRLKTKHQKFKQDLKDQVLFLKSQKLFEKAKEIQDKISFHFPKTELQSEDLAEKSKQNKEETISQNYSKIIERNLSFELRSSKRNSLESSAFQSFKEDRNLVSKLAFEWAKVLKEDNLDLLLTQLEFLDFNEESFFTNLLKNNKLDHWQKIYLLIKSKNFLEGLSYLDRFEDKLLTDGPESVYNFYYSKATLLLGAGMSAEAEEILKIILEQKENFRDVKILLKS